MIVKIIAKSEYGSPEKYIMGNKAREVELGCPNFDYEKVETHRTLYEGKHMLCIHINQQTAINCYAVENSLMKKAILEYLKEMSE
jgi:hypothetical protein